MTDLFTPITIGPMKLPNRVFMAPMTRNRAPKMLPNELMREYYIQRAEAGLVITEGVVISQQAVGYPATPGIFTDEQTEKWKEITDAVHERDGHIFCQLWHCGRISHPDLLDGELPVAPSAIRPEGQAVTYEGMKDFVEPRELESDEIPGIIADYKHAAMCALSAGFDGVEVHAANGYLIDQFLRDGSNQRDDDYGGSIENRQRFLIEVVEEVSRVWGSDKVGVRLSPFNPFNDMRDSNPKATFTQAVQALDELRLGYLHITEMGMDTPDAAGPAFDVAILRKFWQGVYITNGGYDKARANDAIANGSADAVAFGIPFLANPDLVRRFLLDAPLNEADPDTFYGGDAHGYTDYPALEEDSA